MNRPTNLSGQKRATDVPLNAELVELAKQLGVNLSQACERSPNEQVAALCAENWKNENKQAIESYNAWIAAHGMPYDEYRQY
ncbi:MAG: type II toxin-antitoxin system CcdA family antitoxin [Sphingopyxis sp.]